MRGSWLVTDGGRDSECVWSCDDLNVYYAHEETVPDWDALVCVNEETGDQEVIMPPEQGWVLRDASPKCEKLLLVRNLGDLYERDIETGAETLRLSGSHINSAQYMPCYPGCPWDTDGDGQVSVTDFLKMLSAWGACP